MGIYFFQPVGKAMLTMASGWLAGISAILMSFFGTGILEHLTDIGNAAKVLSASSAIVLSALTLAIARREKNATIKKIEMELKHAEEDQMFQKIERVKLLGWITDDSTDEEIHEAIRRLNNIK